MCLEVNLHLLAAPHPSFLVAIKPESSSSDVLDDVMVCKSFAAVFAGCLTIAMDARQMEYVIE